jgi:C4-dicarboxylate transporter, DctQ subunit
MNKTAQTQGGLSKINKYLALTAGVSVFLIMFITVYEVIVRYLFNAPTMWTFEVTGYLLLIATFLAASYTLEQGGHVNIDLVSMNLKPVPRRWLSIIVDVLGIAFISLWLWKSTALAMDSFILDFKSMSMLQVTLWPFYVLIPLGLLLLLIQYIVLLVHNIKNKAVAASNPTEEE